MGQAQVYKDFVQGWFPYPGRWGLEEQHTHQAKLQLKAKATSRMDSAASIKPQAGVKDELRIQDHRTVGEASRDRGHVPEERVGNRSTEERAFEDHPVLNRGEMQAPRLSFKVA